MPYSLAISSADWPMLSPVDVSVMLGATGGRSLSASPRKLRTRPPGDFACENDTKARARGGLSEIGTLDNISTPPATTTSAYPRSIRLVASVMAWMDEAHARVTV